MAFTAVIRRDLLLAIRHPAQAIDPLIFFLLVIALFPLGASPRRELLELVAPGVFWIAALLSTLLSLERMFRPDFEDGSLDLMLASPAPLPLIVLAKIIAHWLVTAIPLLLAAPLFSLLLGLPTTALPALLATLVLGTPTLSAIGAIGVALTTGLQRGGVLLSLLVLPLYVPVLVFATGAISAAANDLPFTGQIYILGALAALSCTLGAFVAAAALKIATS
ncbi:heme exporter protein CcmB [Thioalkalivibrio sp. HK1]|uniref:heme exporter protein CcmB n=1 Tax=Thioalkalivibrio sp. HK1 TaxID=1469245 RepID=UPI000472A982|nr:heme exporter protein CcmB [Thioalkalivibrio sp. HK1]